MVLGSLETPQIDVVLSAPGTSAEMKVAIKALMKREPLQAVCDAFWLHRLMAKRASEALKQSEGDAH
jgi:hypothetical protein